MECKGKVSKAGVFIFDDFRDQIIIDRYSSVLESFIGRKQDQMRSKNSEDVITWNCFRTLIQVDPVIWISDLFRRSFGEPIRIEDRKDVQVTLGKSIAPPSGITWREGWSEIDVIVEWPGHVWYIEAKYTSVPFGVCSFDQYRSEK
ncbi:hypothetical protein SAMN04487897_103332 [Paenibacillus sp. yr247]|uniref:hypothetical protein n=1 Tax=Paenibacillus sp. yr247 TaxID=1761880 RepID=UPI00088C7186|nr:hypothetical protein [Paenibacillus sp. yr247]SDN61020.1 hypothetical protein SAMN04487897_103332 [Paenibacillus sp. yr247]